MLNKSQSKRIMAFLYRGIHYLRKNAQHLNNRQMMHLYVYAHSKCQKYAELQANRTDFAPVNPLDYCHFALIYDLCGYLTEAGKTSQAKQLSQQSTKYGNLLYYFHKSGKSVDIHAVGSIDLIKAFKHAISTFAPKKHSFTFYQHVKI